MEINLASEKRSKNDEEAEEGPTDLAVAGTTMNLLSWNCRGLGNPRIVRDLHHMVKEKKPTLVFLMETKVHDKNVDYV